MKKSFFAFVLVLCLLYNIPCCVFASEAEPSVEYTLDGYTIFTYDDGSILSISPATDSTPNITTYATTKTKTSNRTASFTNANGVVEWKYTLTATFSYVEGVSVTCTNTYYTQNIYEGDWTFSDGSATASGNVAYGKGTYVKKFFFITTQTYNIDISLTCDTYGNVT